MLEGHTQDVKYVDWLSEGRLVSCSYDDSLIVWQAEDDDFVCWQVLKGHTSIVWSFCTLPHMIFSVSEDKTIICWE